MRQWWGKMLYTLYTHSTCVVSVCVCVCRCIGGWDAVYACIEQRQMDGIIQGQTLIVCNFHNFVSPSLPLPLSLSFIRCIRLLSKSIAHTQNPITCESECVNVKSKAVKKIENVAAYTVTHTYTYTYIWTRMNRKEQRSDGARYIKKKQKNERTRWQTGSSEQHFAHSKQDR